MEYKTVRTPVVTVAELSTNSLDKRDGKSTDELAVVLQLTNLMLLPDSLLCLIFPV
jgi:hypothetical protein